MDERTALAEQLRALARCDHDDHSVAFLAADEMDVLRHTIARLCRAHWECIWGGPLDDYELFEQVEDEIRKARVDWNTIGRE